MLVMKNQRPYRATRAELRAIDEGLREKKLMTAKAVRAAFRRFKLKRSTNPRPIDDNAHPGV